MRRLVVLLRGTAVTTFFAVAGPLVGFTLFVAWIYFNTPLERRYLPRFSEWISSVQELGIPCAVAGALFFVVHVLASSRMRSALWLPVQFPWGQSLPRQWPFRSCRVGRSALSTASSLPWRLSAALLLVHSFRALCCTRSLPVLQANYAFKRTAGRIHRVS
jgi:hypothetical protein